MYWSLQDTSSLCWQDGAEFPGSSSAVTPTKIVSVVQMTRGDAVKTAFAITFDTGVSALVAVFLLILYHVQSALKKYLCLCPQIYTTRTRVQNQFHKLVREL